MGPKGEKPTFLALPSRPAKPRATGVTHVLDKGMPLANIRALMPSVAEFVDIWKFGWGTAYLDPEVADKVTDLRIFGVEACTGGTLLEVAWLRGRTAEMFEWAGSVGIAFLEVSNGATDMPSDEKRDLIEEAARLGFSVLAEVGSKDPDVSLTSEQWIDEVRADIAAGADWIVAEGRESGTVGLYDANGDVRADLVQALEAAGGARVIYEAPRRSQQAWLIRTVGPHVNLGNIALDEIMSLESLRLGLRTDTIKLARPVVAGRTR